MAAKPAAEKKHLAPGGVFDGFLGLNRSGLCQCPGWVDLSKPPGHSEMPAVDAGWGWLARYPLMIMNPHGFMWSPNAMWCLFALAAYFAVPYDFDAPGARTCGWDVFTERLRVHFTLNTVFYTTLLASVYVLKQTTRRFPGDDDGPPLSRFIHNVWYWALGTLQAATWDTLVVAIYANKVLPHTPDEEAFSLSYAGFTTVVLTLLVPPIRDHCFFWAHVLIHHNYLYKFCHSLHHRNTTLEPFCGLCMHPVEHLLYYSSTGWVLGLAGYFAASPWLPFFCLVHLQLAPAGGHTGWEDQWQSEQFHALHHAKYECNYGGQSAPWDEFLGVYRESWGASKRYTGAWKESDAAQVAPAQHPDPTALPPRKRFLRGGITLRGALYDTTDQALFDLVHAVLAGVFYSALTDSHDPASVWRTAFPVPIADGAVLTAPHAVGLLLALVPHAAGLALWAMTDRRSWRWPFHEKPLARFVPFFATGCVLSGVPLGMMGAWAVEAVGGF